MESTRDYYEALMKKKYRELFKKQIEAQGPIVISDEKLEEMLEKVKEDLDRAEPKKSQLKKRFKKFCDEQRTMKRRRESPQNLAYDNKSREIFGDGDKYDQYKKNRNEFLKSYLKEIKKGIAWENTKRSLGKKLGTDMTLHTVRWRDFLIKEDGSAESRKHNEELYELLALGCGTISKDQFIQLRKEHYKTLPKNPLDDKEAENKAKEESEQIGERIWEMVKEKLDATKEQREKVPSYASYVLSGKAGKNGYPTLKECHRIVDDRDMGLLWDLQKIFDDISVFGGLKDPEAVQKFMRDSQAKGQILSDSLQQAELASNFYFSMVDPFKLIERKNSIQFESPSKATGTHDEKMRTAFSGTCSTLQIQYSTTSIDDAVKAFGLRLGDQQITFPGKDSYMHVIRRETKNDQNQTVVQTAIVHLAKMTDDGPMVLYTTGPEELVNDGFEESVKGFMDTCKDWDREHRTSSYFETMRKALEKLEDRKLITHPDPKEISTLKAQLEALRDTSKDYLDYKIEQRHGEHFRYGFERKRVKLAKKMNEFATKKLKELQYVKEHIDTLALAEAKEKELKDDPDYQEKKNNGFKGGALSYLREKEEAAIKEQRSRERQQREQAEAEEREKRRLEEEKTKKAERKELFSKITGMKNSCENLSKEHDPAKAQIDRYIKDVKAQREGLMAEAERAKNEEESRKAFDKLEDQAKHLLAGRVIDKMLADEQAAFKENPNADSTVHELVNGGKLNELTELLFQDASFKAECARRDYEFGYTEDGYSRMEKNLESPWRVSKTFREDLAKAAEEQKEEAALKEDPKEEPIKEEPAKEEPIKEEPAKEEPIKEEKKEEEKRSPVEGGFMGLLKEAGMNPKGPKVSHPVVSTENVINIKKDPVNAKG